MNILKDKERELVWYTFNHDDDYKFAYYQRRFRRYLDIVDTWGENPKVQKFLGSGKPLGHYMKGLCESIPDYKLYFATNLEGELVSALVTSTNDMLKLTLNLENHLLFGKDEKTDTEEFITKSQIRELLDTKDDNNIYLAFNVVAPEYQGHGIGTRILSSVKNNLEYFAGCKEANLQMTVDHDNIASHKVVYKNGFRRLNPAKSTTEFSIYYLHAKSDINEQNNNQNENNLVQ